MEQKTHFFFAIKIPDETKFIMKSHCEKLQDEFPFNRWVHHEDLHITLAFLGSAHSEQLKKAEKNVQEAIQNSRAFTLQINRLGIFGKDEAPRIFWTDIEESDELQLLRKKVFTACTEAGFQLETRLFRPHITLARKWKGEQPFQKELLTKWSALQSSPLPFLANEVVLYQTHLQKTPKYEEKLVLPLNKN